MRIMTFNTLHCKNFLTQEIDYPLMANVIADSGADVVALNEIYGQGSAPNYIDQTGKLGSLTGMTPYFGQAIGFDGVKPYGNGLLSKMPILKVETILIPDPVEKTGPKNYETRSLIKATLAGGITVLVTHFGLNTDEQESAVKTILENMEPEKCILMGDFNAEPEDPVLQPIFARFQDAAVMVSGCALTFPSTGPVKKIDYIFVTPDVEILHAEVPQMVASDHFPHTAEIKL